MVALAVLAHQSLAPSNARTLVVYAAVGGVAYGLSIGLLRLFDLTRNERLEVRLELLRRNDARRAGRALGLFFIATAMVSSRSAS